MSYKFQKFTTVYPEFSSQFLLNNPDYKSLSYERLYERFVRTRYGWANYYAKCFEALGHEAQDLFADLGFLQKTWADEHGVGYSRNNWCKEIVLAQIRSFRPDVLYLEDLYFFDAHFRQQLREVCGKRVLMIGWQAAPSEDFGALKDLDLVLTCAPHFAQYLQQAGANAAQILHAFEPSILTSFPDIPTRDLDFTFLGSLVLTEGFHRARYELIEKLLVTTPLQVWGQVTQTEEKSRVSQTLSRAAHALSRSLNGIGVSQKIRSRLRPSGTKETPSSRPDISGLNGGQNGRFHSPVFGMSYYEILSRSKITLNSHIDCAEQFAGNMRLFEATGMGACLITDSKSNLSDLFEPEVEVVTYAGAEECIEKVNYLINHDEERKAIAAAGQRRVMRDHTFERRATYLDTLIRQAFHKL